MGGETYKDSTFEYIQWPEGYYEPYYIERFEGYMIYLPLYMCFPKIKPNMKIEIYGFRRPTMDKIYIDKVLICYPGNPLRSDFDGDGLSDGEEFWYGTSPADSDTDDDHINDLYDTNPLGNAELYVEMTKFSLNLDCVGSRSYTFNIYQVEIDSISTFTFYNVWPTGWGIPFDVPDDISSARIRIYATCTCCFFDCDTYYIDLSKDRCSDFSGRTLELKVNMKYGYRFNDPTSSWDDDWTQFTTEHPINDPSQTVDVTIIDKSGYGYASGYEDNVNESSLIQGEIWFETIIEDCDGKYWVITRSAGNKVYELVKREDGLPFWLEADCTNTSPGRVDTDGDGISDAWEDSDGDGAFNIQEIMIGKNPANPHDVLGIQLRVSVEWSATDEEIAYIREAFRIASRYIFDYTDGHAFISKVEIYNNKQKWYFSNVRIHHGYIDNDPSAVGCASVGGYWWFMKKKDRPGAFDLPCASISYHHVGGDVMYFAGVLGHELGHYVFWFYDEYKYFNGQQDVGYSREEKELMYYEKRLLTVMGLGIDAFIIGKETQQELSTYSDYRDLTDILPDKNITSHWSVWSGMRSINNTSEWY